MLEAILFVGGLFVLVVVFLYAERRDRAARHETDRLYHQVIAQQGAIRKYLRHLRRSPVAKGQRVMYCPDCKDELVFPFGQITQTEANQRIADFGLQHRHEIRGTVKLALPTGAAVLRGKE